MKRALCFGFFAVFFSLLNFMPAQETGCRQLDPEAARRFLPERVPLEAELVPVDMTRCSVIQFPDKARVALSILSTSLLSGEMRDKYQYILITESRLRLSGSDVPAGLIGLAFEPEGEKATTARTLVLRDYSGSILSRLQLKLDDSAHSVPVSLTPKGETSFELRIGKYVIQGQQR